ncbi:MAG: flagellar hook protein FlgE [Gammaproteobacteria bacterium]|nr:flagellar hook protein FlgE [Gammaproteobacteria bacterium]
MPFRIALSGLNAASADLSVTAHNIANASTLGFKQFRTEFSDVLSDGVQLAAETQRFGQGAVDFTGSPLDMSITGEGFFTLSDGGGLVYSRAGAFGVDNEGYVVNSANQRLQVYPDAGSGIFDVGALQDLRLATGSSQPVATSFTEVGVNLPSEEPIPVGPFDPDDPSTFNFTTSITTYDSLGTEHTSTLFFGKTATPNMWDVRLYVDDNPVGPANTLEFSSNGTLTDPASGTVAMAPYDPGNGSDPMVMDFDFSLTTQYGGEFVVNTLNQNGLNVGRLTGIDIDGSGRVLARFTNGRSQSLGQIALTNFSNFQGLQTLGDNTWGETFASGPPLRGEAGKGSLGLVQSGSLEQSNVDLTAQLVQMITAQRNFQANAQMISTADTVTQTIINLR